MKIFKKIIICLILSIFILFNIKKSVSANNYSYGTIEDEISKSVTVIAGYDYTDLLTYDGYTSNIEDIDFNKEGEYYLEYVSSNGIQRLYKKLYIVKSSYNQNTIERLNKVDYKLTYDNINIVDNIYLDKYDYYLYKAINTETDAEYNYVYKFLGNIQSDKYLIGGKNQFVLNSLLYRESTDEFLITGVLNNNNSKYVYFSIYNKEMELEKEVSYSINNSCTIKNSKIVDNYLYIIGTTNSNCDFFYGCVDNDVFLLKINLDTDLIEESYISRVKGYETVSDLNIIDNEIYFISSYVDSSGYSNYSLKVLDDRFQECAEYNFGTIVGFDVKCVKEYNKQLYVLCDNYSYSYSKSISSLYVFNSDLTISKKMFFNYNDYRLNGIDLVINDSGIVNVLFMVISESNVYGYSLESYLNYELIYSHLDCTGYKPVSFNNSNGNSINVKKNNELSKITFSNFISYSKDTLDVDSFKELEDEEVIVDNTLLKRSLKYSSIDYDDNYYGNYLVILGYSSLESIYLKPKVVYVKEDFNVSDNCEYNINYKVSFNGTAYLNGSEIDSDYEILDEGDYTLEVYGINDQVRKVSFKIVNNVKENIIKELDNSSVNYISELDVIESENSFNHLTVSNDIINETVKTSTNYWIVLIPIIIGVLLSLCIIKAR